MPWKAADSLWWARQDLNLHGLRHGILSPACLPFHHSPTSPAHESTHETQPLSSIPNHLYRYGHLAPIASETMRTRLALLLMGAALLIGSPALADAPARRDWWVSGPGGPYGLIEVQQPSTYTSPAPTRSHTTLLFGPWRATVPGSAPQVVAVLSIFTLTTAFTWGWIRTRRR